MASTDEFTSALSGNKNWAKNTSSSDPELFPTLSGGQHPAILWLGCADSRVPETTLLGLKPGDVFTHRNIANVLPPTDINSQSVIAYAVEHLKVKHVVLCGHTSCGGAAAALGNNVIGGPLDLWLQPLRKLRETLSAQGDWKHADDKKKALMLVEANVKQGVETLKQNPFVISAVNERGLQVHGVVYDITCGELKEVDCADHGHAKELRDGAFATK